MLIDIIEKYLDAIAAAETLSKEYESLRLELQAVKSAATLPFKMELIGLNYISFNGANIKCNLKVSYLQSDRTDVSCGLN